MEALKNEQAAMENRDLNTTAIDAFQEASTPPTKKKPATHLNSVEVERNAMAVIDALSQDVS